MRGKKIGIGLCILGMLFGCTKHEPKLIVKLFYLDSCGGCQELHQNLIVKIEEQFHDEILIERYDMDQEENKAVYDETVTQIDIDNLKMLDGHQVPFLAVEGYFATVGYSSHLDEHYLNALKAIIAHEDFEPHLPLGAGTWLYKEAYRGI